MSASKRIPSLGAGFRDSQEKWNGPAHDLQLVDFVIWKGERVSPSDAIQNLRHASSVWSGSAN